MTTRPLEEKAQVIQQISDRMQQRLELETRKFMLQSNPSHQTADAEVSYRWGQERKAMAELSTDELTVCLKLNMAPTEYQLGKR